MNTTGDTLSLISYNAINYTTRSFPVNVMKKDLPKPVLADIDFHQVRKAALIIRSLNHDLRQKILEMIDVNDKITVTEIYKALSIEQSIVSQHLALLRKAGFLKTTKNKKFIYYSLNREKIQKMELAVNDFTKDF